MQAIIDVTTAIANWFWGVPILILVGGGGLYLSIRCGFVQIRKFSYICSQTFGKMFQKAEEGKISPFAAACSALGSSIGASNIVGVPVAIALGGPGAVFWMWLIAIVGCCTKYCEIALAVKYKVRDETGTWFGGAFSYIKEAFGIKRIGIIAGTIFALCGAINCLPSCASQILSATAQIGAFNGNKTIFGIIIIAFVTLVVFGGIKRIAAVMEKTVPFMAIIYLLGVLVILVMNYDQILPSLGNIIKYAFTSHAAFGGFTGATIALAMRWGIARGVYSNEAGYGTAAIAHSASDVDHPIRQAVWGVFEVGVDTLLVCTATALAVLTTGVWTQEGIDSGALGQAAFGTAFGRFGEIFVAVCVLLFVLTTIIVVIYYGEKNMQFVFKTVKAGIIWRCVILAAMVFALFGMELTIAYQFIDFIGALKIIPNMLALIWLAPQVVALNKEYFNTPGKYYMADMEAKKAKKAAKRK